MQKLVSTVTSKKVEHMYSLTIDQTQTQPNWIIGQRKETTTHIQVKRVLKDPFDGHTYFRYLIN